jgi:hypothetical protein
MVATLASQFFIVWVIDKFGWFKNYDVSGSTTFQKININDRYGRRRGVPVLWDSHRG